MNKLVKTMGLSTVITTAMLANSVIHKYSEKPEPENTQTVYTETSFKKDNFNSLELWSALTGLSVLGLAGAGIKDRRYKDAALESEIQNLISASDKISGKKDNTDKAQKCRILESNLSSISLLMKRHKIVDEAAFAHFEFTFGALIHAVEYNENPNSNLKIVLEYLAKKAITPKNKFKTIDKQYRADYRDVNFNHSYGVISYIKKGTYNGEKENTFLYKGLSNFEIMERIQIIKENVYQTDNGILMYKHDRENLLSTIRAIESAIRADIPVSTALLYDVNDLYCTKRLKKNIEI